MITVAEGMVQALEKEGVSVVFGYPGAAICPFYDCLGNAKIHHVLVRQEQNAGHAASGYARMSGKAGVVVVTSGPGATNLITALATAYMDSIPLVAITGQVSRDQIGRDVFQEADITGAAEPFTKHAYLVKEPESMARVMKEAFHIATTGRPGPVLIDVPIDVQRSRVDFVYPDAVNIRGYKPTVAGNVLQVRRVAEAIGVARRPLLCIGGGVISARAQTQVGELATRCGIPMVVTLMGISAVPSTHPLYLGMLGMHGNAVANEALHRADLLIVIGARVGDRAMAAPSGVSQTARIVHIDVDPAEIGKNLGATIPVVGDAAQIVGQLLQYVPSAQGTEWAHDLAARYAVLPQDQAVRAVGYVNPKAFMRSLSERLQDGAVVVADVGQNQIWAANQISTGRGIRFLTSGGMGTMGYSLPAALGVALAAPERQVVSICGDGSLQMMMCELSTVCQEQVPVKLIVMTNRCLGMVREVQRMQYAAHYTAVALDGSPDFLKLAAAYGIPALRVTDDAETPAALDAFLQSDTAMMLECCVDPDETTI